MLTRIRVIAAGAIILACAFVLPSGAAHAVGISFTSTAEAPVRFFDGSPTYLDVSFAGAPSGPFGPCPTFCTANLTEDVQTGAFTNTEMWSVGPIPPVTLNETRSLSYDLSITLDGTTVTETITYSLNVDFHSYNDSIFLNVLGGPVTTFDFGMLGKIDVWVGSRLSAITQSHDGGGGQFYTQMRLYDVGATQVREPASAGLLLAGVGLVAVLRRCRRKPA